MEGDKDLQGDQVPLAVQATNDDSIVSKRSAARFGYMKDEFLRAFVRKPPRRSQLINRGYYIRCQAIRSVLRQFLELKDTQTGQRGAKQIISLGAGFDTSFWVLKEEGSLQPGDKYIEVDFPELIARKSETLRTDPLMAPLMGKPISSEEENKQNISALKAELDALRKAEKAKPKQQPGEAQASPPSSASSDPAAAEKIKQLEESLRRLQHELHMDSGYNLIAGDLRDLEALQTRLSDIGVDFNRPTLLFAECVFTYMQAEDSSRVIQWAAGAFQQVAFMTYEQINTSDCFGRVMRTTLKRRNSPLLGVAAYPTLESQQQRFLDLGFSHSTCVTMLDFWEKVISHEEWNRITLLEEYDEQEEWEVKCSHYFVEIASIDRKSDKNFAASLHEYFGRGQPSGVSVPPKILESTRPKDPISTERVVSAPVVHLRADGLKFSGRASAVRRWAHASVALPEENKVIVIGGFGGDAKQGRLNDVFVLDTTTNTWTLPTASGAAPEKLMFHSATLFGKNHVFVFAGRAAPSAPFSDAYLLDATTYTWRKPTLVPSSPSDGLPIARWRHTATRLVTASGNEVIVIFGGRKANGKCDFPALDDVWCIDPNSLKTWRLALDESAPRPPARYSHVAVAIENGSKLLINGGNDGKNRLSDTWILDLEKRKWEKLTAAGQEPPARFSHAASGFTGKDGREYVVMAGGCTPLVLNDMHLFDVSKKTWTQMYLDAPEKWARQSMMLTKHTAHVVATPSGLPRLYLISGGALCFSFGIHFNEAYAFDIALPGDKLPDPTSEVPTGGQEPTKTTDPAPKKTSAPKRAAAPQKSGTKSAVKEMRNVTKQQWLDEIYAARVPVLMKSCDLGPCVELWKSPQYFLRHDASKKVSTRISTDVLLDFVNKNYRFETMPLSDFMSKVFDTESKEKYYFRSVGENMRKEVSDINQSFPEIAGDFHIPEICAETITKDKIHSSALRISSKNIRMWTHYDVMDNILCQIVGRKKLILWEPEEVRHLYFNGTSSSAVLDIENPDLDQFPRFAKANCYECILEPGDVLFIPSMWHHNVITLDPSVSVNIFYRHLAEDQYPAKDLYGNKDPVAAEKALLQIDQAIDTLKQLPEYYREFYARTMIEKIKAAFVTK